MYKSMLPELEKIRDGNHRDLDRYQFILNQDIDTTRDSLELAEEDLGKRGQDVKTREANQRKTIESQIAPAKKDDEKKKSDEAAEDDKPKRKPPTLLRPGEKKQ
jgi:hypothetical protein